MPITIVFSLRVVSYDCLALAPHGFIEVGLFQFIGIQSWHREKVVEEPLNHEARLVKPSICLNRSFCVILYFHDKSLQHSLLWPRCVLSIGARLDKLISRVEREANPIFPDVALLRLARSLAYRPSLEGQSRLLLHIMSLSLLRRRQWGDGAAGPPARLPACYPHCLAACCPPPIEFSAPNYELKTDRGEKPIAVSHIRRRTDGRTD